MKSFKKFVAEVAQPEPEEEKRFKDMHSYETVPHPVAEPEQHTGEVQNVDARRIADQRGEANYDKPIKDAKRRMATEEVEQVDEVLDTPGALDSYRKKADASGNKARNSAVRKILTAPKDGERPDHSDELKTMSKRNKGQKMADNAAAKLFRKSIGSGYTNQKEEVEQLDELSPETLNRYKKKSMDDESKRTVKHYDAVFGVKGEKPSWDDTQKALRKIKNRVKGRKRANKQLGFDNNLYHDGKKLTNEKTESAAMDRARYDADDAAAPKKKVTLAKAPWDKNEELSPKQKKIDHNKNGKIDGHDLAMLRKKKNEEVGLDEAAYLKGDLNKRADAHEDQADHHNREADKAKRAGDRLASTTHAAAARAHMKAAGVIDRHLEKPRHLRPDTAPTGSARAAHKATLKANSLDEGIIDEISKNKMGQYIKRAHDDKDTQRKRASIFDKKGMDSDKDKDMYNNFAKADRAKKKAANRTKFIGKAVDRMTKESVELAEEGSGTYAFDMKSKEHMNAAKKDLKDAGISSRNRANHTGGEHALHVKGDAKTIHKVMKKHSNNMHDANMGSHHDMDDDTYGHKLMSESAYKELEEGMVKPVPFKGKTSDEKGAHKLLTKVGFGHGKMADHHEPSHIHPKTGAHVTIMRKGKAFAVSHASGQTIVPPTHIDKLGSWLHDSGHDKSMTRKEEVEVTETTSSAIKKMVTQTGPDGKTRTVMKKAKVDRTDDYGQDKIDTRESVELKEAVNFKRGPIRLKDGSQIMVSKEDADLLTKMFKDLSPNNQREMQKIAMTDKAGFEEIRGFAREAL